MGAEDQMFENKRVQLITRTIVIVSFFVITGLVTLYQIKSQRPPEPPQTPAVTLDGCAKLCTEGVKTYDSNACECNPPRPPPAIHVEKLDCTCVPMTDFQKESAQDKRPVVLPDVHK